MELEASKEIQFYIHDELHSVKASDVAPDTTLNTYLRRNMHLTGTKYMCKEGGCGACVVGVTINHPVTKKDMTFAVNSCLVPLIVCQSWKISTVEGIGNAKIGFHKIQKTLANFNGTQCGFCSGGMVMNMYSLLKQNPNITMKEMENSFGGNLCRCTGYRPILTAFKTLCSDADASLIGTYPEFDIEDLHICPNKEKGGCQEKCQELCVQSTTPLYFELGASKWYKVFTISEIFRALNKEPKGTYMLVSGHTSVGVYPQTDNLDLYIDITSVAELRDYKLTDTSLTLGANMTLSAVMKLFREVAAQKPKFKYLDKLADHIDLVANVPVRNIGTLAGNLSIKHEHKEFPSDIFLILETVGATMTICVSDSEQANAGVLNYLSSFVYSYEGSEVTMSIADYLSFDMYKKVIKNIKLPALNSNCKYESYKIMQRAQNTHALVNAGFLLTLDGTKVVSARIVYGCINPSFIHATETEKYLVGKDLFNNVILQGAYAKLDKELVPDWELPDPSPQFRKKLAISLFYKYILSICPPAKITPRNKSGGQKLSRPVSTGTQNFNSDKSMYPVGEPIAKIEALAQTSGAAEYINDMQDRPNQLFAAFVLANAPANSTIKRIDKSVALKMKGVVGFFDKNDIPGKNTFTPLEANFLIEETLFCKGVVEYYHQPIGIIVATSTEIAEKAASLVKVEFEAGGKPLLTIRELLKANAVDKIKHEMDHTRTRTGGDVKHTIKGTFDIYWQYHFHMETQICNVIPIEDGIDMIAATQYMDANQTAAAMALNIPANKVNLVVRRLGGAFGAKISRNCILSTACAIAAHKLQKPVKLIMPFVQNMNAIGRRYPLTADYEVQVNDNGVIQKLDCTYYNDYGVGGSELVIVECLNNMISKYLNDTWQVSVNSAHTDTAAGTWTRAPGTTEGLALIECIMDHIAYAVNKDSLEVRLANLNPDEPSVLSFINQLKNWADIDNRKKGIEEFNKLNRWVKKGISVVPNNYNFAIFGNWTVLISIYNADGTVAIRHGGIEMGQGINTKAAAACAFLLGIPLDKISIKPSDNVVSPNAMSTGGSISSEAICYGVQQCCEILNARIKVIRDTLPSGTPWEKIIKECYLQFVDLTATYMYSPKAPGVEGYRIYGVCATEVLLDVLTGQHIISRVDLLEDTGNSISPWIDIGQVEGAYVMGLGYYTTEEFVQTTEGQILTNRTWNYRVPGAKDIPVDFRVKFPENNPNPVGVLKSKATAEPPFNLTISAPLAIRHALSYARADADKTADRWYKTDGPTTVENVVLNSLSAYKQFTL